MRQFLKFMFASALGTLLLIGVLFFILVAFVSVAISGAKTADSQPYYVEDNTVLLASFDSPIIDRGLENPVHLSLPLFQQTMAMGLDNILDNLEKAQRDENIEGIFLDLSAVRGGMGQLKEIRDKLVSFKQESGKWVMAYSDSYTQASYYLASTADEVYLQPSGNMDFRGLRSEYMFYKNMFEKLDIDMQFIRGSNNKFKSFGEVYTNDHMSEANREQTTRLITSIWDNYLDQVSASRNISKEELKHIADSLLIRDPESAVEHGLIDGLKYRDEVLALIASKANVEEGEEIEFAELTNYTRTDVPETASSGEGGTGDIAVIYAEGDIMDGESMRGVIGGTSLSATIREAREDEDIKAVVLRVNSPGGSALASDVIWREVELTKQIKPVVVSMGNVAASGGYYISCAANTIFADATTVTGSIGVFGMIPNMEGFFNNKLGITFDGAKTNTYADMLTYSRALRDDEKAIIQGFVDDIYGEFKQKVATGRNMTVEQVDAVGQGRVWTGLDAKENGLVDEIGGLEDAIAEAKQLAGLGDYDVIKLPEQKDLFEQIMEDFTGQAAQLITDKTVGTDQKIQNMMKEIEFVKNMSGIQARMPYSIRIH